ncbi:MAG: J domain-containing protein [Acidimicrobiales bacterium]
MGEATRRAQRCEDDVLTVVDLSDGDPVAPVEPDPVRVAQLAEYRRACAARDEAIQDLQRLRARHWSGERLVEEGRATLEWWEHPDADPHAVLGLLPGARLDEASSARRRIALQCHPDRLADSPDPDLAVRRMVAANAAYDRLRRALLPV